MEPELPFEFLVAGTPVSLQSSADGINQWKERVRAAATLLLPENHFTIADPVRVDIFVFLDGDLAGDLDNIIKPIQDALNGLVYRDDHQVSHLNVAKFVAGGVGSFENPSDALVDAITGERPVVYVKVSRVE